MSDKVLQIIKSRNGLSCKLDFLTFRDVCFGPKKDVYGNEKYGQRGSQWRLFKRQTMMEAIWAKATASPIHLIRLILTVREIHMSQTIWPWSGGPDTIEKQWKVVRPQYGAEQQHRLLVPPKHGQRLHPLPSRRLGRRRGGIVLFYQWPARRWTLFDV